METRTIKPFPWMCAQCRVKSVVMQRRDYRVTAAHDMDVHEIVLRGVDIPTCPRCGQGVIISEISEMVTAELRRAAGILTPEQIQAQRESLGLTQAELAATLRVSEAELARWESGMQLQSKAVDLLLRLYLGSAEVRQACGTQELVSSVT